MELLGPQNITRLDRNAPIRMDKSDSVMYLVTTRSNENVSSKRSAESAGKVSFACPKTTSIVFQKLAR